MTTAEQVRCRGCRRELHDPVSRARRYGPGCWERRHPAPPARHHLAAGPTAARRPAAAVQTGPDLLGELPDPDGPP